MISQNLLTYFPAFAGLGIIFTFWGQFKNFIVKIFSIFWKSRIIIDFDIFIKFYKKLYNKSFVINFDDYMLSKDDIFSVNDKRYLTAFFKLYKMELFLYKKFIPIFVYGHQNGYKISYLKFTFDFDTFFKEILKEYYEKGQKEIVKKYKEDRFYVNYIRGKSLKRISIDKLTAGQSTNNNKPTSTDSSNSTSSYFSLYPNGIKLNRLKNRIFHFDIDYVEWSDNHNSPIKNKYIFTKVGKYVKEQVDKWLNAQQWYEERGISFRRGILLNGKVGTGKSCLILEIAKSLGIPLYVVDLSTFDNQEFCESMDDLSKYPAIILFEDIDSIWDGRNNIVKSNEYGGLTFDTFINKLSGVKSIIGKFIFITTNHLEKMDKALVRPGRIDEIIDLPSLDINEKEKMASLILEDNDLINLVVTEGKYDSTAEFENRCVQLALSKFWS